MIGSFISKIFGNKSAKDIKRLEPVVIEINQLYKFRNKIVILSRPNENFEDVLYYD